jgi:hypothetical protein
MPVIYIRKIVAVIQDAEESYISPNEEFAGVKVGIRMPHSVDQLSIALTTPHLQNSYKLFMEDKLTYLPPNDLKTMLERVGNKQLFSSLVRCGAKINPGFYEDQDGNIMNNFPEAPPAFPTGPTLPGLNMLLIAVPCKSQDCHPIPESQQRRDQGRPPQSSSSSPTSSSNLEDGSRRERKGADSTTVVGSNNSDSRELRIAPSFLAELNGILRAQSDRLDSSSAASQSSSSSSTSAHSYEKTGREVAGSRYTPYLLAPPRKKTSAVAPQQAPTTTASLDNSSSSSSSSSSFSTSTRTP